jgi:hypothetical protein
MWLATRDDEQAVSTHTAGPPASYVKASLPEATLWAALNAL